LIERYSSGVFVTQSRRCIPRALELSMCNCQRFVVGEHVQATSAQVGSHVVTRAGQALD
jgi:hypothetical protein